MINFNTNVLETNIINLSFVIGVLIYFGGDVINSLLEDRLKIILNSLEEVKVLKQSLEEITVSPSVDSLAQDLKKSENDLIAAVERMRTDIRNRYTKEISDLEIGKKAKISFEEDKATSVISEQIKYLTVELAVLQIENRVLKVKDNSNLGFTSEYQESDTFNRTKKYGHFFNHAINRIGDVIDIA